MLKKVRTALTALVVIALLCSVLPVYASSDLAVEVGSAQAAPGSTVTIELMVTENVGISYLSATLDYDKTVLELTGVSNGSVVKDLDKGTNLAWSGDSDSTAIGTLATLTFKVAENAALGSYMIKLIGRECYNENFDDVSFSITEGTIDVVCAHANTTNVAEQPADCNKAGYTAGVFCNGCQTFISGHEVIPATGKHSGGEATCKDKAICDVCGNVYGELNANNHKGETEIRGAVAEDCGNDGYTGDTYCLDCGEKVASGTVISATGKHAGGEATCKDKAVCDVCGNSYGELNANNHKGETEIRGAVTADCGNDGYTGDSYCLDCGEKVANGSVIPATGKHTGGEATCKDKAVCDVCGKAYGELNANNHKGETEIRGAVAENCGNDGYTGDTHCVDCNIKLATGTVLPATGKHTGGEATCKAKAVCAVCGNAYGELNADNHKGETEVRGYLAATCSTDGYTGDTYCADCGEKIATGFVITATGDHVDADGQWESNGEAHFHTCGCGEEFDNALHAGGEATCKNKAVCDVCGNAYGEVNADNHKGDTEVKDTVDATCSTEGYTGDTYCVDCGEKLESGSVIPASGKHTGGEATCKDQAVCDGCGQVYGEVDADNHKGETEVRDALEATCGADGYTGDTYCVDCGAKIASGTVVPATGNHADIDENGVCDGCGADVSCKHTGETEIKGMIDATCDKDGYTGDLYCADCGEKLESGSVIAATGEHTDSDKDDLCDVCGADLSNPQTDDNGNTMLLTIVAVLCIFAAVSFVWADKKRCIMN